MDLDVDTHQPFIERAIDLAATASDRGDNPFGSLLVRDGEIRMEATNRVNTEDDLALHPELTLARRAASEVPPDRRRETVMYTSTEPCAMCATGIAYADLGAVVYSVSGEELADRYGGPVGIRCGDVFDRFDVDIQVRGGVCRDEGFAVHDRHHEAG